MQYNIIDVDSQEYKQEQRRITSLRTQAVLWLIVLALAVTFIPLMLINSWVRKDVQRLETELWSLQSAIGQVTGPSEEAIKLSGEMARVNQLISTMQTVTVPSGLQWPLVVDAIARYDPAAIEISSLTQMSGKIQIDGRAASNDAVVRYQQTLLAARIFGDVVVISMTAAPPTPTPEAAADDAASDAAPDAPFGSVEFVIDLVVESAVP